ncbi:MAG TPA: methyltransferase domain-containing protein [Anaerolineales bacterium]|nr:methyltransferase domain-containing protein [Anaerolineales bacterium]
MTDYAHIYSHRADEYHRFISVEDLDGNLLKAIESVALIDGKRVIDLGTGTGRLPLLFAHRAAQMIGLDLHRDMLRRNKLGRETRNGKWGLTQGDMRRLPLPNAWADLVTAGWSISFLLGAYPADWQAQIGRVIREMQRVCAPGGTLIIFETLTTGSIIPAPPSEALAEYYAWLESEWGFTRQALSTDYQFESVAQAVELTEFFFGPELSEKIRANGWARLPEWTGMWSLTPSPALPLS